MKNKSVHFVHVFEDDVAKEKSNCKDQNTRKSALKQFLLEMAAYIRQD